VHQDIEGGIEKQTVCKFWSRYFLSHWACILQSVEVRKVNFPLLTLCWTSANRY